MPQWCYGCLLVVVALISGCGDPVENAIEGLIAGGDQAEKARMELNLAKRAAIAPTEAGADPLSFALCRASVAPSIDDRLPEGSIHQTTNRPSSSGDESFVYHSNGNQDHLTCSTYLISEGETRVGDQGYILTVTRPWVQ